MNIQDWFPLGWTGWISLQSKGLSRVFSNTTVQKQFFLILFLNFTILYWFCQISKWIRHRYTCVPHPKPSSLLPPPSPYHPSGSSQCTSPKHPVSCIEPGPAYCFIYYIHVSKPFSQIIPPSPSPTESKKLFCTSVSLLLPLIQGYCYHLSKFHIYALVYWFNARYWMLGAGALGQPRGMVWGGRREEGGGFRMGNTCIPVADSFRYLAKPIQIV